MDTSMASTSFITKEQPQGNAGSIAVSDVIRVSLELPSLLRYIYIIFKHHAPREISSILRIVDTDAFGALHGEIPLSLFDPETVSCEVFSIEGAVDPHRHRQAAGTSCEKPALRPFPSMLHEIHAGKRLDGADKDAAWYSFGLTDNIEAGIHAINEIHIGMTRLAKDHLRPRSLV